MAFYTQVSPDKPIFETTAGTFGGPNDNEDDGKFYYGGGSILPDGSINPENYAAFPQSFYDEGVISPGDQVPITYPGSGKTVLVTARDRGPGGPGSRGRGLDIAPHTMQLLGADTDKKLMIDFGNVKKQPMSEESTEVAGAPDETETGSSLSGIGSNNYQEPSDQSDLVNQDIQQENLTNSSQAQSGQGEDYSGVFGNEDPSTAQVDDDGTVHFANGTIVHPDDTVEKTAADKRILWVKGMDKPIVSQIHKAPVLKVNQRDGRTYDLSDPENPKEIKFPEGHATLSEGDEEIAKKLSEYKWPIPGAFALKSPQWISIISRATELNPSFDATKYQERQRMRVAFTSGKQAQNKASLNQAVQHLSALQEAAKELNNYDLQFINSTKNWLSEKGGSSKVTNFRNAVTAVQNEMATVFKGTSGTDQEIQAWRNNINSSQSPEQLQGDINELVKLMGGRIQTMQSIYEGVMGENPDFDMLTPEAKSILGNMGVDPDVIEGNYGGEPKSTKKDDSSPVISTGQSPEEGRPYTDSQGRTRWWVNGTWSKTPPDGR